MVDAPRSCLTATASHTADNIFTLADKRICHLPCKQLTTACRGQQNQIFLPRPRQTDERLLAQRGNNPKTGRCPAFMTVDRSTGEDGRHQSPLFPALSRHTIKGHPFSRRKMTPWKDPARRESSHRPDASFASRDEISALQLERLKKSLHQRLMRTSTFTAKALTQRAYTPDDLHSLIGSCKSSPSPL